MSWFVLNFGTRPISIPTVGLVIIDVARPLLFTIFRAFSFSFLQHRMDEWMSSAN